MNRLVASLLLCLPVYGDDFLSSPLLGCYVPSQAPPQRVLGLRGNFLTEPIPGEANSVLCSGGLTVSVGKEQVSARLEGEEFPLPTQGEPALTAVSPAGHAALAAISGGQRWFLFQRSEWKEVPDPGLDPVAALAILNPRRAFALTRGRGGLWLATLNPERGAVVRYEPLHRDAPHAVLFPDGAAVVADGATLVLLSGEDAERQIEIDSPVAGLHNTGGPWVAVETANGWRALFRTPSGLETYHLPGAVQQ
jgi:hypothetical protein